MNLSRVMPFAAVTFTLAGMASMGLPGFSGFWAELQVLVGAWQAFPTFAVVAGFGILVGVAYIIRVVQQAFFGEQEGAQRTSSWRGACPQDQPQRGLLRLVLRTQPRPARKTRVALRSGGGCRCS